MQKNLSFPAALVFLACGAALGLPKPVLKGPSYSSQATAIWENIWIKNKPKGAIRIPSPDGANAVTAAYDMSTDFLLLTVTVGEKQFQASVVGGVGSELAWSPDSKAFFLTYSDAGLGGEYHTPVYYVSEHGLRRVNTQLAVKRAFGHPVPCSGSTLSNVVGVGWLEGSQRLLIAAQVPPLSFCDSFNTFKAFELSLPGAVVIKPYGQIAAKKKFWPYLGKDLRNAPDTCITDPKSCEARDNHPDLD